MRNFMFTGMFTGCALALVVGAGCKWTEFDDLEGQTSVTSTDRPNSDSTDYGVAIQRGQKGAPGTQNGGKLVVLGTGQAQYTELVYSANGDSDLAPTAQKLNSQFGIGNLDQQPILIADPAAGSDNVSLIVNSGGQSIAVLTGTGGLQQQQVFGPDQPDAATYMIPPPRTDIANATPSQVLVGSADAVYGAFLATAMPPNPQPKCQLVDVADTAVAVRGLGAARVTSTTFDDVVVWGAPNTTSGVLLLYPGGMFNGPAVGTCTGGKQSPIPGSNAVTTTFSPSRGSQIIMVDPTHFLAVGHKELGVADSFLGFYSIDPVAKTITAVGTPISIPGLRTATVLTAGAKKYVAAGYPTDIVDNVKGGRVLVFALDMTAGLDGTPAATIYDAQPEDDQQFGRAVAAMPFNGGEILAVAADNEIFTYFRLVNSAGTAIYDESRTGR